MEEFKRLIRWLGPSEKEIAELKAIGHKIKTIIRITLRAAILLIAGSFVVGVCLQLLAFFVPIARSILELFVAFAVISVVLFFVFVLLAFMRILKVVA